MQLKCLCVLHFIKVLSRRADDYSRNLSLEDFGFSEPYGDEVNGPVPDGPQAMLDVMIDYGAAWNDSREYRYVPGSAGR